MKPFIQKLLKEKKYMDSLRGFWAKNGCPKKKLPSNEDLKQKFS